MLSNLYPKEGWCKNILTIVVGSKAYHQRTATKRIETLNTPDQISSGKETTIDTMSFAGVGNVVAGTVAVNLNSNLLTK